VVNVKIGGRRHGLCIWIIWWAWFIIRTYRSSVVMYAEGIRPWMLLVLACWTS